MKWCIVGAGAIGGVVGAKLFEAGEEVVLVARGEHLRAVRDDGLVFVDPAGRRTLPIPAVGSAADAGLTDEVVVLLAVKAQHTATALADLVAAAPAGVKVVCLQNGLDNERQVSRFFEDVVAANVTLLGSYLQPGVVMAHSAPVAGTIQLGRYVGVHDGSVAAVAERLAAASITAPVAADIMAFKRAKLIVNLGNVTEIVCPSGEGQSVVATMADEARRVFAAAGMSLPPADAVIPAPEPVDPAVPRLGGSTKQSVVRGAGSVETDYLNGEIALLGRLHGVPTPANVLLQAYARRVASGALAPGSVPEAELLAALGTAG